MMNENLIRYNFLKRMECEGREQCPKCDKWIKKYSSGKLWRHKCKIIIEADKNMLGGMDQHALMDLQDELQTLGRIMSLAIDEIPRAFFIVETTLDVRGLLCHSKITQEDI